MFPLSTLAAPAAAQVVFSAGFYYYLLYPSFYGYYTTAPTLYSSYCHQKNVLKTSCLFIEKNDRHYC